jgi:hypothetical protein
VALLFVPAKTIMLQAPKTLNAMSSALPAGAWCGEDECESSAYTQAIDTIWKIILVSDHPEL